MLAAPARCALHGRRTGATTATRASARAAAASAPPKFDLSKLQSRWRATQRLLERSNCDTEACDVDGLLNSLHQEIRLVAVSTQHPDAARLAHEVEQLQRCIADGLCPVGDGDGADDDGDGDDGEGEAAPDLAELRARWAELCAAADASARASETIAGLRAIQRLREPLTALFAQAEAAAAAAGAGGDGAAAADAHAVMEEVTATYVSLGLYDDGAGGDGGEAAAPSRGAGGAGAGGALTLPGSTLVGFVIASNAAARGVSVKRVLVAGDLGLQWEMYLAAHEAEEEERARSERAAERGADADAGPAVAFVGDLRAAGPEWAAAAPAAAAGKRSAGGAADAPQWQQQAIITAAELALAGAALSHALTSAM